ncbi:Zinc/iron permease [Venturia nashicola]|uniref:Zinc/iron permease n=1 Tax=Venturia nashicola TaxID=86259 RepID=A0A4Z1NPU8_9PEZI|nr:Zinc/iron permease [Venturia nashicola]
MTQNGPLFDRDIPSWADIPTAILQSELARRHNRDVPERPACGGKNKGSYNTPIHVGALILILALSTIACAFPIIARKYPHLPIPHQFIFLSRHFGTGVLIATAFVHLFPTAYISLTDPCLPSFWNQRYPAMPGLIAMISVLTVVGIEQFFAMRGAGHSHSSDFGRIPDGEEEDSHHGHHQPLNGSAQSGDRPKRYRNKSKGMVLGEMSRSNENLMDGRSPSIGQPSPVPPPTSKSKDNTFASDSEDELDLDELDELGEAPGTGLLNGKPSRSENTHQDPDLHPSDPSDHAAHQKALLQCLLLEAGILFHSVFIGMALSVSTGPPFAVLLVAISFHQTFEGLALGSRISALQFPAGSMKPWLMALAYGTTTPIGQAIGLAIHRLYDPESMTGLLTVGMMNAISSGLLLFAGLVELLAEDFLSDGSYKTLRGKRRLQACGSVVAGAFLMALVGAWA